MLFEELGRSTYIGKRLPSREDPALLRGSARFVDDLKPDGTLYAAVLRSSYAHARILDIRTEMALAQKDVIAVITYEDVMGKIVEPPNHLPKFPVSRDIKLRCLAKGKVRYVGEPVALVLATNRYAAEDSLEHIEVDYQPLKPLMNAVDSLSDESNIINEEWGSNISFELSQSNGDVEEAFKSADLVIERKFVIPRSSVSPMEPRGCLASYDVATGTLTMWSSTPSPHLVRNVLATALMLDENRVRVIATSVGGNFGQKGPPYPEEILASFLSIAHRRPVKFIETRSENISSSSHAREQVQDVALAVRKDGRMLGLKTRLNVDLGAFPFRAGHMEAINSASYLTGCYDIPNYEFEIKGTVTNKCPLGPSRAFGKSAPSFIIERLMDIAARELRLDPLEIRFRNFVSSFPYTNAAGAVYDSGNYPETLRRVVDLIGYKELRNAIEKNRSRIGGGQREYLGVGFSSSVDPTGLAMYGSPVAPYDGAIVRISRKGQVNVYTGACGLVGTGHQIAYSQIVAEKLGVRLKDVEVMEGDTQACPVGIGSFSDRSTVYTASAVLRAAEALKSKVVTVAASIMSVPPEELEVDLGKIYLKSNPDRKITFEEVARVCYDMPYKLPSGTEAGLEATSYFSLRNINFWPSNLRVSCYPCAGNCSHAAFVKVDIESGKVQILKYAIVGDSGRIINPDIVEAQLQGGVTAGIGGSTLEEIVYDQNGNLLSSTLVDYLIPSAMEVPEIKVDHIMSPSPLTPLGTKGTGESGTIGSFAAVANAVNDALSPLHVEINNLPLKPETIRKRIGNLA